MKKCLSLASVVAIAASAYAAPAMAQSDGVEEAQGANEIVITARKRAESLQDVPMSVAVISGDRLVEQNIGQIENLQSVTAGLIVRKTPNNLVNLTLRGLGTGTAIDAFEQSVATFVDGTYAGRGPEFNAALFDFQRVEIIRGAQASLLSKNTSLGAISLVTQKPGRDFGFNVTGTWDLELGSRSLEAGVDLPLSDIVQVRVAGKYDDQHGYVYNSYFDKDVPRTKNAAGRITLAAQPSDGLDLTLMYQYFQVRQKGMPWEIYSDPSGNLAALSAFAGYPTLEIGANYRQSEGSAQGQSYDRTSGNRIVGTINYEIGGGHTITSVTGYSDFDSERWRDTDLLPGDYLNGTYLQSNKQFQQEIRLSSPAEGQFLDYVVGASYFHEKWFFSDRVVSQCIGCPAALTTGTGRFTLRGSWVSQDHQTTRDLATFAQVNLNFSDTLTLSGGARYTNSRRRATLQRETLVPGAATTVIYQAFAPVTLRRKENNVDGSVALNWKPSSRLMLYGSYSKGTKAGGFNNSATNPSTVAGAMQTEYGNETAHTVEIGEKLTLPGGGFFNVAVFQTNIKGFQQATFNGSFFNITGEDLRARGVEAEAALPLGSNLRLQGQLTYADTVRKATGLNPPGAPKWSGNVSLNLEDQEISNGLALNGNVGVEFRSHIFLTNEENTIGFPGRPNNVVPDSPGYGLINARLGLKADAGWEVALVGRNLNNKKVFEYSVPISFVGNGSYVMLNRPRTVALQLTFRR
ncbi:TonB-dependent receptor [Sphingomonas colocasiae]|uniref:TonB-dependent receptor n=1 Tax=Sphingomonas colocasiae TaxID=1848973 RepID=A0ABS7PT42_9SPHN|nr:TonB-dependent receptor [Sphingomonas colocasiae]MBY8824341.1 TonB-dependent receptor [Sphingomonas colocasiae]